MNSVSGGMPGLGGSENGLLSRISNATSSGHLSRTDGAAINSALGDIAGQLQSSASTSASSSASGTSPRAAFARVGALIDGEVQSGKLTEQQASELKSFLQPQKHGGGPGGASRAPGGRHGADNDGDGHDGGVGAAQASSDASKDQQTQAAGQAQGATQAGASDPLAYFLKMLRDTQTALSNASYSNTGTAKPATTPTLGIVDSRV